MSPSSQENTVPAEPMTRRQRPIENKPVSAGVAALRLLEWFQVVSLVRVEVNEFLRISGEDPPIFEIDISYRPYIVSDNPTFLNNS